MRNELTVALVKVIGSLCIIHRTFSLQGGVVVEPAYVYMSLLSGRSSIGAKDVRTLRPAGR